MITQKHLINYLKSYIDKKPCFSIIKETKLYLGKKITTIDYEVSNVPLWIVNNICILHNLELVDNTRIRITKIEEEI